MSKPEFIFVEDKSGSLVYLDFALKAGAITDPQGKTGIASMTMSMLLRGTKRLKAKEFHEELDALGAEIHLGKHKESLRVYGVTLKENLANFMNLFSELLTEPRFDSEEFEKLKKQFKGALTDELSSDEDLADRRFQEHLLWGHPYGNIVSGSLEDIDNIKLEDLKNFYKEKFCAGAVIFSALGPINKMQLKSNFLKIAKALPAKKFKPLKVKPVEWKKGWTLLLLDKPGATQSQIIAGIEGISFSNKDYVSMQLGNHVFGGGSFSARLMKEIREKRGWSYGAYAWNRAGKEPICLSMQTIPSTKDTVAAVNLMMELLNDYAKKGITREEFDFAKKSLVNQAAFLQDTLRKKLDNKISEKLLGLKKGFYDSYQRKLSKTQFAAVQKAIKKNINSRCSFVLVLGDLKALDPMLKEPKGFNRVFRKRFDQAPGALN